MKTTFHDRTGKDIYIGDIVLWSFGGLSKKSGGPVHMQVRKTKKGIKIIDHNDHGFLLRKTDEQYLTIVDTQYRDIA